MKNIVISAIRKNVMPKVSGKLNLAKLNVVLALTAALISGCGAGSTDGSASGTVEPTLSVALTSNGLPATSISSATPATVKATLKDSGGSVISGAVVTFSTDSALATISPATTALTDSSGIATVTLSAASVNASGAATIKATSQVGTVAVNGSKGFSVGAAIVAVSNPVFGQNPISSLGSTSVSVNVTSGGSAVTTPQTVTFSSPCASSGKALMSQSVDTVNGVATNTYTDKGCTGPDTVTVSVSGITSSSALLNITAPTAGSIEYVSSIPDNISLKGTGGKENAQVTFKVLDSGGNPISGKTVLFGLSTSVGGITLSPNNGVAPYTIGTATSDANGTVSTTVNAGTVSTPVRVTASTCSDSSASCGAGTTLTTQSSLLSITTGIPDQFGFSLSATKWNIEGLNYDGTTTVLTARLADHFKNPIPDNTSVVFTAESGSVVGACSTVDGSCSVPYTSQGTRPTNGRATVLAYAVGEETFTDLNGSGWADLSPTNEMIDPNGDPTDLAEAFIDYNENGTFDAANETFIDFNQNQEFDSGDGKLSGVLCDDVTAGRSSAGTCSSSKTIHVRYSGVIILSSSDAEITIKPPALPSGLNAGIPTTGIVLPSCHTNGAAASPTTFTIMILDRNGNAMAAGSAIAFSSNNASILSSPSGVVTDSTACRFGYSGCPPTAASTSLGDYSITMMSDATVTPATDTEPAKCVNPNPSGFLTVTVTSPESGTPSIATMLVTD